MKFTFRANLPLILFLLTTFTLFCGVSNLVAQEVASLTGVVTDSTGAVVADATVGLIDTKTNATYETKTNELGGYTFTKLLPGPGYSLTISKVGFQTQNIGNI